MRAKRLPPSAVRGQHGLIESWCAWPYTAEGTWFRQGELVQSETATLLAPDIERNTRSTAVVENRSEAIGREGIGLDGIKHDDVVLADESTVAVHPVLRYCCCYQSPLLIARGQALQNDRWLGDHSMVGQCSKLNKPPITV